MKKMQVQVEVPLLIWKEGDQFVAYTPALELSSCGSTEDEAIKNFAEAVELFFETANERHVVDDLLESLGWTRLNTNWIPVSQPVEGSRSFPVYIPTSHAA